MKNVSTEAERDTPKRAETLRSSICGAVLRRCRQYSLRALLTLVVAVALPLWWLRTEIDDLEAEHDVIATLERAEADVTAEPAEPRWLWRLVPERWAPNRLRATHVMLTGFPSRRAASSADLWLIGRLRHLKRLTVNGSPITDGDLAPCAGLTQLESLSLDACVRITDAGLRHFTKARGIRSLGLGGTAVSDDCLDTIQAFASLESLGLVSTRITDAGMPRIARFKGLRALHLPRTVTSIGLGRLAELERLTNIGVWVHRGDDVASLRSIGRLPALRTLIIWGDGLTDAGLQVLASATSLQELTIYGGDSITIAALKNLPKLRALCIAVSRVVPESPIPGPAPPTDDDPFPRRLNAVEWAQQRVANGMAPLAVAFADVVGGNPGIEVRLEKDADTNK